MNKIERVRAALAGGQVDRVPASFWFHFTPDKACGEASVKAHLDYYRESGIDYLKVMNEHLYQADVSIKTPSDWKQLRPAPLSARFYQEQLDEIKRIVDELQDECLVITTLFNPFSSGNDTSGRLVTEHLKADPESVSQGLTAIADSLAEFALACVDAGAAGIYYSAQGGEEDRFTEEEFLQYIKPHDLTVLNAVKDHGEFHLLHICGDRIRLPAYADYPGHAVNWAATERNLGLKEGRELFQRTIMGGMDNRGVVVDGSPDEIQTAVREVIADLGTRGFILGADCTFPTDIPVANIRMAVEATAIQCFKQSSEANRRYRMECPKCHTSEMELVVFEGIEVDRCPGCGGVWFDTGEAESLKQFKSAIEIDTGDALAGIEYDSIENVDCPRGHGEMETVVSPNLLHIYFETCSVCHGVWFDAGEFTDYAKGDVAALFIA